jgi:pimeloyl-ACP methyl ester carboxylesterase
MDTTTSADGTTIVLDVTGHGPAVVLVGGAFNDRTTVAALAEELSADFTAVAYDRRGRGGSGDTKPYAVEREIEDLAAVIDHVGGSAYVVGHSSGAILSLRAAAQLSSIKKVAAYEPPFVVDNGLREVPGADMAERTQALIDEGRRDEAVELFMTEGASVPAEHVAGMRSDPSWAWLAGLAHTLPYDLAICGNSNTVPTDVLAKIAVPALVVAGGASPEWFRVTARAVTNAIPGARTFTMDGEDHGSVLQRPATLAKVLREFLGE